MEHEQLRWRRDGKASRSAAERLVVTGAVANAGRVRVERQRSKETTMFERLNTPEEIFNFKLGAALKMEQTVLEMLGDLEQHAQRDELKEQFRHHADETRQQIANIERSFELLGEEPDTSPCPAIEGLEKEGKATIKKTDDRVVDAVILAGAAETEHHEIAVYETLITNAKARGATEVAQLLEQNLEQEQHTLQEVRSAMERIATQGIAVGA
jgi:ferritin-like metal-binding protein YciE